MLELFDNMQDLFNTFCEQANDFIEKQKDNQE